MKITHAIITAVMLICLLNPNILPAENWPEFRGPTGQGLSTASNLPTKWSATQNVTWKEKLPGTGWSSPVVVDGKIYLTSAVHEEAITPQAATEDKPENNHQDYDLCALCLDLKTGKQLWLTKIFHQAANDDAKIHRKNSNASPTPIVEDGKLYVHFGHQGTACLDLAGKILWKQESLKYNPVHGNGGSPALAGNALIFSCDGAKQQFTVALNKTNGEILWKTNREVNTLKKFAFCTPLVITVNGKQQVISSGAMSVSSLDLKTGEEIWRVKYDGYSVIPRPVFGHGLLFISTSYDEAEVIAIRPDGSGDVTDTHIAWRMKRGAPNSPSMILVDKELYMVSDRGIATCVDAKTGESHWQKRIGGSYSASPISADGKIYFLSESGDATIIEAATEFKEVATNSIDERTLASYAVAGNSLLIRSEVHLFKID